jgi:hypothetical protein
VATVGLTAARGSVGTAAGVLLPAGVRSEAAETTVVKEQPVSISTLAIARQKPASRVDGPPVDRGGGAASALPGQARLILGFRSPKRATTSPVHSPQYPPGIDSFNPTNRIPLSLIIDLLWTCPIRTCWRVR